MVNIKFDLNADGKGPGERGKKMEIEKQERIITGIQKYRKNGILNSYVSLKYYTCLSGKTFYTVLSCGKSLCSSLSFNIS